MYRSITPRCLWLALKSAVALALAIAPYRIAFHGFVPGIHAAAAEAGKGGNGGGNSGNDGGSSGHGNSGNGHDGNGNSGNGNSGNSGTDSGDGSGGNSGSTTGQADKGVSNHVNVATGDKVETDGKTITVQHPDGLTEKVENGRFRMEDALGRTIIDRRATPADIRRLKAL